MQIKNFKHNLTTYYKGLKKKFEKLPISNKKVAKKIKLFKDYDFKIYYSRFKAEVSQHAKYYIGNKNRRR